MKNCNPSLARLIKSWLVVVAVTAVQTALPASITFTFTGSGSGSLGSTPFVDDPFQVVVQADTANVNSGSIYGGLAGTIQITGLGSAAFTLPLYVFNNPANQAVGFGNNAQLDLIDLFVSGVGLDTYGLTTSFGPISTPSPSFGQFVDVATSQGNLTFTDMGETAFQAVVPEPAPLASAAVLALGALGFVARRRLACLR